MLRHKLHHFRQLDRSTRRLLYRSLIGLPLTHLSLRLLGLKRSQRLLATSARSADPLQPTLVRSADPLQPTSARSADLLQPTLVRCHRALALARRYGLSGGNCLSRSLWLAHLLQRHGIACDLRIGVHKDSKAFTAHAWLEINGQPINDRPSVSSHYRPFAGPIPPPS